MSLLDVVRQHIGADELQQISTQLGVDPATARNAIDAALPMVVGGMAGTAQNPEGEAAIQTAVDGASAQGGGGLLGGVGGMLARAVGGGLLGTILGQHHSTVQDGVTQASGLDRGKAGELLILLAPFVIHALAKHQASAPSGSNGGLAGSLQQEAQEAQATAPPHVGGILGKILGALG